MAGSKGIRTSQTETAWEHACSLQLGVLGRSCATTTAGRHDTPRRSIGARLIRLAPAVGVPVMLTPVVPTFLCLPWRQAHALVVLEEGPMGPPPVMFCAGTPWWRSDEGEQQEEQQEPPPQQQQQQ